MAIFTSSSVTIHQTFYKEVINQNPINNNSYLGKIYL